MNKIIYPFIFAALSMMVASCSQNVKINVNFADHSFDGKKAYLTVYDSGDTVDSVVVNEKFVAFEEMSTRHSLRGSLLTAIGLDLLWNREK